MEPNIDGNQKAIQKNLVINTKLKEFVQSELAPAKIVDVRTEEIEGIDGEPLLRIWVVYETKNKNKLLDPEKTLRLSGSFRQSFAELCTSRFPLFSFIIPEEADFATS